MTPRPYGSDSEPVLTRPPAQPDPATPKGLFDAPGDAAGEPLVDRAAERSMDESASTSAQGRDESASPSSSGRGDSLWARAALAVVGTVATAVIVLALASDDGGQDIANPDRPDEVGTVSTAPIESETGPAAARDQAGASSTELEGPRASDPAATPEAATDPAADPEGLAPGTSDAAPAESAAGLLPAREAALTDTDPMVLWVDPEGGDDGNDGQTPEQAWGSLQHALDRLEPGNTLNLMSGTYSETRERVAHYVLNNGGRADAWIRIQAAPGERPVIQATLGNGLSVRANYVEVVGLEVVGRGFDASNPYGWGLLVREADHVRFRGNRVSGMPVGGIAAVDAANIEILDNEVFENSFWGTEQGSGISIWHAKDRGTAPNADGYHDVVSGNVVYRNENKVPSRFRTTGVMTDGNGIIIDQTDETGYSGRTLVANNVVFDNGGRGILVLESSRVDVVHNTTFANGRTAKLEGGPVELAAGRAHDVRFVNNLAWSLPGAPALRHSNSTGVVTEGNLLVSESDQNAVSGTDRVVTGDPGLIAPGLNPATADFRPAADSPAVGLTVPAPASTVATDIDGRRRSGAVAAGAHQPAG